MNMHGIIQPDFVDSVGRNSRLRRVGSWFRAHYLFVLIVIAPTVLTAGYFFGFASDQYASEAHFLVRSSQAAPTPAGAGGLSQILSLAGGTTSQSEAMSVADYLSSHDAVAALSKNDDLINRYDLPQVDYFSRLHTARLTPEKLLKYYRGMVKIEFNSETGITTLSVRSFRPTDSYVLVRKLLQLGESRVNELNKRSYNDSIALARQQVAESETALTGIQAQMMRFRQSRSDIDPTATGQAQIGLVNSFTERLAVARAQLNAMRGAISANSPQLQAMETTVRSLERQVAAQSSRLTGADDAIATDIGGYEKLKLRQELQAKNYEGATAALSVARQQAQRQQLYVVHVVEPNMPVKSLYPERWRICGTVLLASLLVYSIGWLLAAGVREHAA
jgi:capsular polysaccharide transport system permease protein